MGVANGPTEVMMCRVLVDTKTFDIWGVTGVMSVPVFKVVVTTPNHKQSVMIQNLSCSGKHWYDWYDRLVAVKKTQAPKTLLNIIVGSRNPNSSN